MKPKQPELFEVKSDIRIQKMRNFIRQQLSDKPFWFPTARSISEIGKKFDVVGSAPLKIFEKIAIEYCECLESADKKGNQAKIEFYKNRLQNQQEKL